VHFVPSRGGKLGGSFTVYELTNFRELSPSSEATNCAATQEFPFYGTERYITVFTRAFSDPYPEPYQSSLHQPILFLYDIF
jgi:hypothetical protein